MFNENKLIENIENVKNNLEYDQQMKKIREEVKERFKFYEKTLKYMASDAPLGILCLPTAIEKALIAHGCLRVYDLFDLDFTEVKGLGTIRIGHLTACLDQFFAMF